MSDQSRADVVLQFIAELDGSHVEESDTGEAALCVCESCGRSLQTSSGLAVHKARAHGASKAGSIKRVLEGNKCPVCN